jgi:hypothetical protein
MTNKFVLESFQAYLEFSNTEINEAKDEFTPDLSFVKGYVDRLLAKQKELGLESNTFSKYAKDSNPFESWLKNYQSKKGKDWPGKESPIYQHTYGAFAAPYLWPKLTEDQKKAVYDEMLKLMKKSGYTKEKEFNNIIKEKPSLGQRPFVSIIPSTVEVKEEGKVIPGKITIIGIDEGIESKVFKDNRWGSGEDSAGGKVNADAFQDPTVLEGIKKEIDDFMKKFASGSITKIDSLRIESSASRYKNTNDTKGGKAEKLSWGELAYNRAITILDLFSEAADTYNLSEEKRKELTEKVLIDSKGTNGDGTSGPNPPGPTIGFGYYDENSKWVPNNGTFGTGKSAEENRKIVVKAVLGDKGKPTGKYTTSTEDPKANALEYSQFRYVNFIIEAEGIDEEKPIVVEPKTSKKTEYTPRVAFPRTSEGGGPPKKKRTRKIVGVPGTGLSPLLCPGDQF